MKKALYAVIVMSMAASLGAVSITDYMVPVSSATSAIATFNYQYATNDSGAVTSNNGNMSLTFSRFYYSLPFAYNLNLNGLLRHDGTLDSNQTTYNITARAQANKYLIEGKDLFGFGGLDVDANSSYERPEVDISAGAGYGRFINATPLARALRVQEELIREGVLTRELSDQELVELAKLLDPAVQQKYRQEYDYWQRRYLKAIEDYLKGTGKLKNNELGSAGAVAVNDVLNEHINDRYYGYEVSAGIGYQLLSHDTTQKTNPFLVLNLNFAYPISLKSQFVERTTIRKILGDTTAPDFNLTVSAEYSYQVSNTIDFVTSYTVTGEKRTEFTLTHSLNLSFVYYIVNKLNFANTISVIKTPEGEKPAVAFQTGLTYRIR